MHCIYFPSVSQEFVIFLYRSDRLYLSVGDETSGVERQYREDYKKPLVPEEATCASQ